MKNKAYIVANEQQESEVLEKLEREGYVWRSLNTKPTIQPRLIDEPIPIFAKDDKRLTFDYKVNEAYLTDYEIVFDGRKEEKMSEKYVVSQEFMNELEESVAQGGFVSVEVIEDLPNPINNWRICRENNESNNRLIAIIRWVNGQDVFEVEKPKKWIVRSKDSDLAGDYWYVYVYNTLASTRFDEDQATHFNTKEEAESWANSHQEVIEVDE